MEKYIGAIDSVTPAPFSPIIVTFRTPVSLFFTNKRVIFANIGYTEKGNIQTALISFRIFLNKAATENVLKNKTSPKTLCNSNDKNFSIQYAAIQKIIIYSENRFGLYTIRLVTYERDYNYYLLNAKTQNDITIMQYLSIIKKALPNTEIIQKSPHDTTVKFIIITGLISIIFGLLILLTFLLLL